ncbi:WD40-repeat-containing domain [Pseudocohnilembus persalinus]|uniref:WD40-repeat-containing domain n=1 Tax=Pseudocohnilembus persalinus TaxID=266149 RepID=A0A0V0QLD7_PSEPJ|nr:WD40-repeat-containing domain [Pseudocohnilembus persalinus]|eukprot:KRX02881.1 WD40-repeat-containing domain [Pseudocohnilembus persalinus]
MEDNNCHICDSYTQLCSQCEAGLELISGKCQSTCENYQYYKQIDGECYENCEIGFYTDDQAGFCKQLTQCPYFNEISYRNFDKIKYVKQFNSTSYLLYGDFNYYENQVFTGAHISGINGVITDLELQIFISYGKDGILQQWNIQDSLNNTQINNYTNEIQKVIISKKYIQNHYIVQINEDNSFYVNDQNGEIFSLFLTDFDLNNLILLKFDDFYGVLLLAFEKDLVGYIMQNDGTFLLTYIYVQIDKQIQGFIYNQNYMIIYDIYGQIKVYSYDGTQFIYIQSITYDRPPIQGGIFIDTQNILIYGEILMQIDLGIGTVQDKLCNLKKVNYEHHDNPIQFLNYDPELQILTSFGQNGSIINWLDTQGKRVIFLDGEYSEVLNYYKSPYANQIFINYKGGIIKQYDLQNLLLIKKLEAVNQVQNWNGIFIDPTDTDILIAYNNDWLYYWQISTGQSVGYIQQTQGFQMAYKLNDMYIFGLNLNNGNILLWTKGEVDYGNTIIIIYFNDFIQNLYLLVCDPTCKTCYDKYSNNCLSCYDGYIINNYDQCDLCNQQCATCVGLLSNQCLSCYDGYFLDTSSETEYSSCIVCHSNCFTCVLNSKNCIACNSQYYLDNSVCYNCDALCLECYGPSSNNCLSCQSQFYLDSATDTCLGCDSSCLDCYGPNSNNCLSCMEQFYLDGSDTCQSCDLNCFECYGPLSNNCISCNDQFYLEATTETCEPCDVGCLQCSSSSNNCSSCDTGYTLSGNECQVQLNTCNDSNCVNCPTNNAICVECQFGYYSDGENCQICGSGCTDCEQNANHCTACIDKYYVDTTDYQCKWDGTCYHLCTTCGSEKYHNCNSCIDGYFLYFNRVCLDCDYTCLTCNGGLPQHCLTCDEVNYTYNNGNCIPIISPTCSDGFFDNGGVCEACYGGCKICTSADQNSCQDCDYKYYLDGNQCLPCSDINCDICPQNICYKCVQGYSQNYRNRCVESRRILKRQLLQDYKVDYKIQDYLKFGKVIEQSYFDEINYKLGIALQQDSIYFYDGEDFSIYQTYVFPSDKDQYICTLLQVRQNYDLLVAAYSNGLIVVWEYSNQNELYSYQFQNNVNSIGITDKYLYGYLFTANQLIVVYDLVNQELILSQLNEQPLIITYITLVPQENTIFIGFDSGEIGKFPFQKLNKQLLSPVGLDQDIQNILVIENLDILIIYSQNIYVYDYITLSNLHTYNGHNMSITKLIYAQTLQVLISIDNNSSQNIYVHDLTSFVSTELIGHTDTVFLSYVYQNYLYTISKDNTIIKWFLVSKSQLSVYTHTSEIICADFNESLKVLVVGDIDNNVFIYDIETDTQTFNFMINNNLAQVVIADNNKLSYIEKGQQFINLIQNLDQIIAFDIDNMYLLSFQAIQIDQINNISCKSIEVDNNIIVCQESIRISVIQQQSNSLSLVFQSSSIHLNFIQGILLDKNNKYSISYDQDGRVVIFQYNQPSCIISHNSLIHSAQIVQIELIQSNNMLITIGKDQYIKLFQYIDGSNNILMNLIANKVVFTGYSISGFQLIDSFSKVFLYQNELQTYKVIEINDLNNEIKQSFTVTDSENFVIYNEYLGLIFLYSRFQINIIDQTNYKNVNRIRNDDLYSIRQIMSIEQNYLLIIQTSYLQIYYYDLNNNFQKVLSFEYENTKLLDYNMVNNYHLKIFFIFYMGLIVSQK